MSAPVTRSSKAKIGCSSATPSARAGCHEELEADAALTRVRSEPLEVALGAMHQGLCMWDAAQRILVCNQRYRDLFGFSADVVKSGATIREVFLHAEGLNLPPAKTAEQ